MRKFLLRLLILISGRVRTFALFILSDDIFHNQSLIMYTASVVSKRYICN